MEYNQRVQLLALFKQVKLGSYSAEKDTGTGYFDMVGADRRYSSGEMKLTYFYVILYLEKHGKLLERLRERMHRVKL